MRTRSFLPAATLLFGCTLRHHPVAPEPARGPTTDSLFRLDQTRGDSVAARGGVDGVLALLGPTVVYLRGGVPAAYGRDAARAVLALSPPTAGTTWQPLGGGVSNDLHSGYTFGVTARPSDRESGIRLERYIAFWSRTGSAPWRITAYAEVGGSPLREATLPASAITPPADAAGRNSRRMTDALKEIRAGDSLFSDLADRMGVGFAFSNTVAPYGAVFGAPQLVVGPKAVQEFYAARGTGTAITWQPVYGEIAASLDLGFTVGEYSATSLGPSGAAVQRFGKYLTIWKRQPNGSWKFMIDGGNGTPARPTER